MSIVERLTGKGSEGAKLAGLKATEQRLEARRDAIPARKKEIESLLIAAALSGDDDKSLRTELLELDGELAAIKLQLPEVHKHRAEAELPELTAAARESWSEYQRSLSALHDSLVGSAAQIARMHEARAKFKKVKGALSDRGRRDLAPADPLAMLNKIFQAERGDMEKQADAENRADDVHAINRVNYPNLAAVKIDNYYPSDPIGEFLGRVKDLKLSEAIAPKPGSASEGGDVR